MSALELLRRLERQTRGLDEAPAWIRLDADQKVGRQMRTLLPELIELARAARIEVRCNSGCAKSYRSGRHHPGCPMNDCCETADALAALDAKAAAMETEA